MIVDKFIEELVSKYDEINNNRMEKYIYFFLYKMIIFGFFYFFLDLNDEDVNIYC